MKPRSFSSAYSHHLSFQTDLISGMRLFWDELNTIPRCILIYLKEWVMSLHPIALNVPELFLSLVETHVEI